MFATLTHWTFKPGSEDEVRRVNTEILVPMLAAKEGFLQYYAVHTGADRWMTVLIWNSQEEAERAYQDVSPSIREQQGHLTVGMERFAGIVDLAVAAQVSGQ